MKLFIISLLFIMLIFLYIKYKYNIIDYYKFKRESYTEENYKKKNIEKYVKKFEPKTKEKYLFQTYVDKSKIPMDIYYNIKKYAPTYKHLIYDDNDIEIFLKEYFNKNVLDTFKSLKEGAHKADLTRYCLLYIYGGLYLDIKTELIKNVSNIFVDPNVFYSVISHYKDHLYQGIISTPPLNPLFLSLIDYIVTTGNPSDYIDFCKDMYTQINKSLTEKIKSGKNITKNGSVYYLFEERCSDSDALCYDGLDRRGLCCFIWDGKEPIIKTRRSSYGNW